MKQPKLRWAFTLSGISTLVALVSLTGCNPNRSEKNTTEETTRTTTGTEGSSTMGGSKQQGGSMGSSAGSTTQQPGVMATPEAQSTADMMGTSSGNAPG